ncbi:unnamed protein product [Oppiella nova]|uniref:Uncharacterized protein n=1 Tax=Oppiella nova TaxID=334625 RepID=A0A7R9MEX0_9ACAR|nr:unnamed protein product [Oppiella nova]CAG2174904.1 unnamed protein product [Oppiella nova]
MAVTDSQRAEERLHLAEYKVIPLESECLKYKAEREQLCQRIVSLESELESAAEASLEANRLLNDFLISQKENNLELRERTEKMNTELKRIRNILKETETNLQTVQKNNEELKSSKSELNSSLSLLEQEYSSLQLKTNEFIKNNDELLNNTQKLSQEMESLREQTFHKDMEIESLKDVLSHLKETNVFSEDQIDHKTGDNSTNNFYDIVKLDLKLKTITNDKNELNAKLEDMSKKCEQLNDKLVSLETESKTLKTECEDAVRHRLMAQTELELLLLRSLRSQLQSMKREITETESKYKKQITLLEKQVHENWILARTAERSLDESKAEATALRQTLTLSVKSVDGFGGDSSYLDDSASSISDNFGPILPPLPPPPPMMNPMMPPMHMSFNEGPDSMSFWNNNPMVPPMNNQFQQMGPNYTFIQSNGSVANNPNYESMAVSSQPMNYGPPVQQNWDSVSNRDSFSPISHRSTNSPHLNQSYINNNLYSQPNSQYSNPLPQMNPMSMSSPIHNSMANHMHPSVQSVNMMSEVSHWVQPNGNTSNTSNLNYSHNEYDSEQSSRSASRNDTSLHTSIV